MCESDWLQAADTHFLCARDKFIRTSRQSQNTSAHPPRRPLQLPEPKHPRAEGLLQNLLFSHVDNRTLDQDQDVLAAANECRAACLSVIQLNGVRNSVPKTFINLVRETLLETSLVIKDLKLLDEGRQPSPVHSMLLQSIPLSLSRSYSDGFSPALIYAGYDAPNSENVLAMINTLRATSAAQPPVPAWRPELDTLDAPFPDKILELQGQDALSRLHTCVEMRLPCVIRNFMSDNTLSWKEIILSHGSRFVPVEHRGIDYRSPHWFPEIKRLQHAIADGDYVAQFALHRHLNLPIESIPLSTLLYPTGTSSGPASSGATGRGLPVSTPLADICLLDTSSSVNMENCWLGPPGTLSPFHQDNYHNIYVNHWGTKFFHIVENTEAATRVMQPRKGSLYNTTSRAVEDFGDPRTLFGDQIQNWQVTLKPGDALFIPYKYWHMVQGLSWNLGVSHWHAPA
ncbi:jmjc domain protein [Gregarina niphandrodes]|uniref:Jmjc domain protein n=1 Tax=Gregarina niphandrodes TaxID=110365 RepID=A0A023AYH4_GRENI|nr:jmjc domain protein [Gregarina niphandrodes]EZG43335.1 jmjc domain protein [Gregarina niphandrodes]|eukprot:XP_011133406.1 jmjc domain protein [Gregarina niphandrodes]